MSYKRTLVALLLTLVAIAVPSLAWLVGGLGQSEREAELERRNVASGGHKKAVLLASALSEKLRSLLAEESIRPFYHYQNLYHDPRGAAEGASISVSPLADGPLDSMVQAHFQVDEEGRLTLPTLNEEFPELGLQERDSSQCSLLHRLQEVAVFCTLSIWDGDDSVPMAAGHLLPEGTEGRIELLEYRAWRQHLKANALYGDLKYRQPSAARRGLEGAKIGDQVAIPVGQFSWHTLPMAGEPSLVALRSVETPEGPWRQGFVVSAEGMADLFSSAGYPASFQPLEETRGEGRSDKGRTVVVPVAETRWGVHLDLSQALEATVSSAAYGRERFLRRFLMAVLAGILAGTLVVAMVYQSERLAAQRAQFAAHAAHELRTPLAGLRLYSEMLAEGLGDPAKSRSYARRLANEAERLGRVVTNVLSFTRLERQTLNLHAEVADLEPAVRDAVARQRPALEQAGASVELELSSSLAPVRFDRDALGQILQNLLDNAEKYTREIPDRKILVSLKQEPQGVALRVADNGHGVAKSFRRRLFRPFHRAQPGEGPEGVGLGLVMVRALAEAQGATIEYADAPGGGAAFTVSFPLAPAPAPAPAPTPA